MAHIDTGGDKKSRNVDLNIIPFIDLMSCLTAFLLVTAVWVHNAQLPITPKGKRMGGDPCMDTPEVCDQPKLSVLVEPDRVWLGVSRVNEFEQIPNVAGKPDWDKIEERLKVQKASSFFNERTDIEVAANSTASAPVSYQTLIATMDVAMKVGFSDVGITDPQGLSARPTM
jgi:biopolymer transport protein TolR